jgi:hypothetical protein
MMVPRNSSMVLARAEKRAGCCEMEQHVVAKGYTVSLMLAWRHCAKLFIYPYDARF